MFQLVFLSYSMLSFSKYCSDYIIDISIINCLCMDNWALVWFSFYLQDIQVLCYSSALLQILLRNISKFRTCLSISSKSIYHLDSRQEEWFKEAVLFVHFSLYTQQPSYLLNHFFFLARPLFWLKFSEYFGYIEVTWGCHI